MFPQTNFIITFQSKNTKNIFILQEFNQEFSDKSTKPPIDLEVLDVRGEYGLDGTNSGPDGKLDYDEFILSARKIPGIHEKFPGISEFMSSFLDLFCEDDK